MPKNVLDIAIGRPTVAASGCVSVTKLVERSAGPHGVTSNAFQRVFLVFGAFLNSSVVYMLINFVEAMVGASSHTKAGGSCLGGKCFECSYVLVWCV